MKIDRKYIVIGICMIIGGVLALTLAFVGPNIITNGTVNDTKVVTGNLKLNITDTSVNIDNMAPIRSSVYENEAFKKEFTISSSESTLNGCMKLYLNIKNISESLKNEYFVYKIVSDTKTISGNFSNISDNKILLLDGEYIESGASKNYTLYIWLRYVEDDSLNQIDMLNTSFSGFVSVNGSDSKTSDSCTTSVTDTLTYRVKFVNEKNNTITVRKVMAGTVLGDITTEVERVKSSLKTGASMSETLDDDRFFKNWYSMSNGISTTYSENSVVNEDLLLKPEIVGRDVVTATCSRKASVSENVTSDTLTITSTGNIMSLNVSTNLSSIRIFQEDPVNGTKADGSNTTEYTADYNTVLPNTTYYIVVVNKDEIASKVGSVTCSGSGTVEKE